MAPLMERMGHQRRKGVLYAAGTGGIGTASKSLLNSNVLTNEPGYSGEDSNNNYYV